MLFYLYAFLAFRLAVVFAWPVSPRSISKGGDNIDNTFSRRSYLRGVSPGPRWILEPNILSKRDTTNNLVDPAGNDIPDGDITSEDVSDILDDKYGLLAIVLGVAAAVLLLLIVLALLLAYHEQRKEAKYKELSDSDDGT
ncbi:unnamed protein product [Rhizoctonia solani]|uniref:Uncharacterized protein n=1 Tax=Rhizoctonia solani TaxID=456999 RepID=A0A8H3GXJ7_9AGAM|nr:unnamed protein product [Rhizoctonia solani]